MAELVSICPVKELPGAGQIRGVTVGGRELCVANVNGRIAVLDGVCPHEGGPLGEGSIEDGRVVCPWHAYAFDPVTGEAQDDPEVKAEVFESVVEDGELRARL
jgi:nitrite reductase (NADH) small subunit